MKRILLVAALAAAALASASTAFAITKGCPVGTHPVCGLGANGVYSCICVPN